MTCGWGGLTRQRRGEGVVDAHLERSGLLAAKAELFLYVAR
jgi:hypothetical protein